MYKTLVVVDNDDSEIEIENISTISFESYLADYPKLNEPKTRIINLCDVEHYLSRGYYCSLLAEARQHKVLPSVSTINDLRHMKKKDALSNIFSIGSKHELQLNEEGSNSFFVFFGWTEQEAYKRIAKQIFEKYAAPILSVTITKIESNFQCEVNRFTHANLTEQQREVFNSRLQEFTSTVWRTRSSHRRPRWDMAILVDENEVQPPSDKEAIKRFIKAASKVGIHAETISAKQYNQINQYDALFIRETTAIDHHTYRMARKAEQEGLVVIDDPTSILRCCNKVFLHDAFTYNKVPSIKTRVIINCDEEILSQLEDEFSYPMVLKMPESSFSKGVFKVDTRKELEEKLQFLLENSALVLVQEFLYTDYDWRVGVLNGRAIYACQYFMAHKHWQIYYHGAKRSTSGGFETLPTFEVPKQVLDAALNACAIIGRGLYGVDIKQKDGHVYVVEVNDNPSIDYNVEDKYLGNELYMLIMMEFASRLEQRGRKSPD